MMTQMPLLRENLVPEDFVDQMLALVDSGTYTYVPSNTMVGAKVVAVQPETYALWLAVSIIKNGEVFIVTLRRKPNRFEQKMLG